jgi:hypothetical protein
MSTTNRGTRRIEPAEARQRRRLENLLYTRKRVAQLANEFDSHGLDDASELHLLQLQIEQVIDDEYPEIYSHEFARWIEEDETWLHHPAVVDLRCSLCRGPNEGAAQPPVSSAA